jgi:hypothetical protein
MSQLLKGSDMDLALRQLIKEYGYTAINQQLFTLAMIDKNETTLGDIDNWYFEIVADGFYNLLQKIDQFEERIKEI